MFLGGLGFATLGMILCAATPNASGFIAGQSFAGFGLMAEELLAIAVTTELVPTAKRSVYGAAMIAGFIPWAPGALYAQLIALHNWRWIGCMIALWHVLGFVIILIFYNPPPRPGHQGRSTKEIIEHMDLVGIALGITGFVVFMVGLNWGGQTYDWASVEVGCALGFGLFGMVLFTLWEMYGAKHPLFPRRMVQVPKVFWAIMTVIFMAGINYVPLAIFWPIESISVFNSGHKETGINAIPVGMCILGGAMISAFMCGKWPQHCRLIMTFFCIMQTAGMFSCTNYGSIFYAKLLTLSSQVLEQWQPWISTISARPGPHSSSVSSVLVASSSPTKSSSPSSLQTIFSQPSHPSHSWSVASASRLLLLYYRIASQRT
jgi:MFS family permease